MAPVTTDDEAPGAGGAGGAASDIEPDRLTAIAPALRDAARRFGTPLYLTDAATIRSSAAEVAAAFPDPWIRQFSVKANDVAAVVGLVTAATTATPGGRSPFGANVVSRGEWAVARAAGLPNARITLEGVGKTDADLAAA
ncbi:MAG: hypothetical protein H0U52_00290, partial [Chloroflexi bacterium]|nr:hypothetical protein [Chloroflexota bacterium]